MASRLGVIDRRLAAAIAFGLFAISSATAFDEGTARSAANNMLSLFGERSPGERTRGELVKTKRAPPVAHNVADVLAPLGGGEDVAGAPPLAPVGGAAPLGIAPAAVAGAPLPVLIGGLPEGGAAGGPGGGFLVFPGVGGGGFIGGGGGGGGGGVPNPGGTVPQPGGEVVPPPVVAPIPEPSTWAMVITGFGFIGLAIRRRRHGLGIAERSRERLDG